MIYILSVFPFLTAQDDTTGFSHRHGKSYISSYFSDATDITVSPVHWKGGEWCIFGGLLAGTAITYAYDREIYTLFQENRSKESQWIATNIGKPLGSGLYALPLAGIFYTSGVINSYEHSKNIALTGIKAILLSSGASLLSSHLFHRYRPDQATPSDPRLWGGPFSGYPDRTAFPSGHTTRIFALASVISYGYRNKPWVGIASYSFATLAGLSRIHDRKHWPSDVIAGAVLGIYIGRYLSVRYMNNCAWGITMTGGIPAISMKIVMN